MHRPKNLWDLVMFYSFGTPEHRRDTVRFLLVVSPLVFLLFQLPLRTVRWIAFWVCIVVGCIIQYVKQKLDL